jgi:hypothetical protein
MSTRIRDAEESPKNPKGPKNPGPVMATGPHSSARQGSDPLPEGITPRIAERPCSMSRRHSLMRHCIEGRP